MLTRALIAIALFFPVLFQTATLPTADDLTVMGGVLRNDGSGWAWINDPRPDGGHIPIGFSPDVRVSKKAIIVTYAEKAKHIGSFVCNPDETLSKQRIMCGASVGVHEARIFLTDRDGEFIDPSSLVSAQGNLWVMGIMVAKSD